MTTKNPILWTSAEAAAVTGGVSTKEWCATGVAISMDDLRPGNLYIATQEDDLARVLAKGAAAAVVAGSREAPDGLPLLKVENVFDALMALGSAARYRTHGAIISVQGREARGKIREVLSCAGSVHEGGRHLSLGLATLPDDIDFGLFGASPAVRPDIAIITNCAMANRDTLFENMPPNAVVIVNADDEDCLQVIARAKAACISGIMTYGKGEGADARILEIMAAQNGTRAKISIMGEEHALVLPPGAEFHSGIMAGLLVLRLNHKPLFAAIRGLEGARSLAVDNNGITLIDPALQARQQKHAVFRVTNMIDLGFGRQTAVLDTVANPGVGAISFPKKDLAIPRKLASFNFVYTSKKVGAVADAHQAIRERLGAVKIATIAPAVLSPGDFLVFRDERTSSKAVFSEALRLVSGFGQRKGKLKHAV